MRSRSCWRSCCTGATGKHAPCAISASVCRQWPTTGDLAERLAPQAAEGSAGEIAQGVDRLIERLQAESTAHTERAAIYRKLLETMHEAIVIESDGIRLANARFAELCGVDSPVELFGRRLTELVHPDFAELVGEYLRRHAAGETAPSRLEAELRTQGDMPGARLEFSFTRHALRGQAGRHGRGRRDERRAPKLLARLARTRARGKHSIRWRRAC